MRSFLRRNLVSHLDYSTLGHQVSSLLSDQVGGPQNPFCADMYMSIGSSTLLESFCHFVYVCLSRAESTSVALHVGGGGVQVQLSYQRGLDSEMPANSSCLGEI